jgi:hypothetical protein
MSSSTSPPATSSSDVGAEHSSLVSLAVQTELLSPALVVAVGADEEMIGKHSKRAATSNDRSRDAMVGLSRRECFIGGTQKHTQRLTNTRSRCRLIYRLLKITKY